jgi:hypothetical protein
MKRAYRTMLPSFMQNHAGPKNVCKKTRKKSARQSQKMRKTDAGQSSMWGILLLTKNTCQTELEDEKNRRRTEPYVGYVSFSPKTRARQS